MAGREKYTIGIDTGGTFTDATVFDKNGNLWSDKAPTTPGNFSEGVLNSLSEVCKLVGVSLEELLSSCRMFKHGTTVATNAVITKDGSKVGLVTTKGFEDTTLIMRAVGRVAGLSDDEIKHQAVVAKPLPIVPRDRIFGVRERIDYKGQVVAPLNETEVRDVIKVLIEEKGVEAIAISFLWSFMNPAHEIRVKQIIHELYPDKAVYVRTSSELVPIIREYARTNTVIIDCFLGKTMNDYIQALSQRLREKGYKRSLSIMQANGGIVDETTTVPIGSLSSGPSGGMVATKFMAELMSHQNVIATDMGGTSFDVGLLCDGFWRYNMNPIVERFHIALPKIDVESIGAGGGTIARVEPSTKHLILGPQSAGAYPGPACYAAGGELPTITDADLILGILNPNNFWGGRMRLKQKLAERAMKTSVAEPLGMNIYQAAAAIYDIINQQMADLIKRQIVRTGRVPEDFAIYAYGGMGPAHAAGYGANLGVKNIYVTTTSPVFSSFGVCAADIIHSISSSFRYMMPVAADTLNDFFNSIENKLAVVMKKEGYKKDQVIFRRLLFLRYRRQLNELAIVVPTKTYTEADIKSMCDEFERVYESVYGVGSAYKEAGIELISVNVDAVGGAPKPAIKSYSLGTKNPDKALSGKRRVFFTGDIMDFVETKIYDLNRLMPGNSFKGPAVIEAKNTTILIPDQVKCAVDKYLNVVLEL
ncbi:MAG: hydantoinase/oxoprolinase family protein [Syntrophales bacterium]|jgi:N-methylhydantoinase A